jgi:hypothetical protein
MVQVGGRTALATWAPHHITPPNAQACGPEHDHPFDFTGVMYTHSCMKVGEWHACGIQASALVHHGSTLTV